MMTWTPNLVQIHGHENESEVTKCQFVWIFKEEICDLKWLYRCA